MTIRAKAVLEKQTKRITNVLEQINILKISINGKLKLVNKNLFEA